MTAGCIPDKILIKDDTYCAIFVSASPKVDCEQSLFFFRFSKGSCTRARAARPRDVPSVTRVAICVSRVLLNGLQKKERLLVV